MGMPSHEEKIIESRDGVATAASFLYKKRPLSN